MSDVKRYRMVDPMKGYVMAERRDIPHTDVVLASDYDALAARVAESDATASALRSCLADLHAVQNGPPLPSYEGAWRRAMDEAERLLGYAGADGGKHGS